MNLEQAIAAMREGEKLICIRGNDPEKVKYKIIDGRLMFFHEINKAWHLSAISLESLFDSKWEIHEDQEIKAGDYVQVEYFKDEYNWQVIYIHPSDILHGFVIVSCKELSITQTASIKYCKKVSSSHSIAGSSHIPERFSKPLPETLFSHKELCETATAMASVKFERGSVSDDFIRNKPHEYKVGDKVWVKAVIKGNEESYTGGLFITAEGHENIPYPQKACDFFMKYDEIKPRGEDE